MSVFGQVQSVAPGRFQANSCCSGLEYLNLSAERELHSKSGFGIAGPPGRQLRHH